MTRSLPTRLLHLLIAAAVIHQLVISLFMRGPGSPGQGYDLDFELHEFIGLASLGLLLIFWLWTVVRQREAGFFVLIPWFSSVRRQAVMQDVRLHLRAIGNRQFPHLADLSPFINAVHGLGLVLATTMAATGAIIYVLMGVDGTVNGPGAGALVAHRALANLVWAYLVGHASMALLHQAKGHAVLQRMFAV